MGISIPAPQLTSSNLGKSSIGFVWAANHISSWATHFCHFFTPPVREGVKKNGKKAVRLTPLGGEGGSTQAVSLIVFFPFFLTPSLSEMDGITVLMSQYESEGIEHL